MAADKEEPWIGMGELAPRQGNVLLGSERKGAWVNVIAWAKDANEFEKRVRDALESLEFRVIEIEDVELLSARLRLHSVDAELKQLALTVCEKNPVVFGTFHSFPLDEV